MSEVNIVTINFNTQQLTNNLLKSIIKKSELDKFKITVFDNSTIEKFQLDKELQKQNNINIIDNTNKQYIDFDRVIKENSNYYGKTPNNFGSLKHTYTIDWIIQNSNDNFILFDSDTVLIRKIDFIDDNYITICGICHQEPKWKNKCEPYIQYFNVKKIKQMNIRYFDNHRIMFGIGLNSCNYDTGTSFLEDIIKKSLPYKEIQNLDYIMHLSGGSWLNDSTKFINETKEYYE